MDFIPTHIFLKGLSAFPHEFVFDEKIKCYFRSFVHHAKQLKFEKYKQDAAGLSGDSGAFNDCYSSNSLRVVCLPKPP